MGDLPSASNSRTDLLMPSGMPVHQRLATLPASALRDSIYSSEGRPRVNSMPASSNEGSRIDLFAGDHRPAHPDLLDPHDQPVPRPRRRSQRINAAVMARQLNSALER